MKPMNIKFRAYIVSMYVSVGHAKRSHAWRDQVKNRKLFIRSNPSYGGGSGDAVDVVVCHVTAVLN